MSNAERNNTIRVIFSGVEKSSEHKPRVLERNCIEEMSQGVILISLERSTFVLCVLASQRSDAAKHSYGSAAVPSIYSTFAVRSWNRGGESVLDTITPSSFVAVATKRGVLCATNRPTAAMADRAADRLLGAA